MLINPTDIADGVLVNAIWAIGQMATRPQAGRRAANNMDIASWADTEALIREALPDFPLELPGLTAADGKELAVALKRNEVQGALQALLAVRLTDASEIDSNKAREAVQSALGNQRSNQLSLGADILYAEKLSEYFDEKICAIVANLEGQVGLAGLKQIRAEAYNARIVALLGAIERQVTALEDPERGDRAEADFLKRYQRQVRQNHGRIEPPDFDKRRLIPLTRIYVPTEIEEYAPEIAAPGFAPSKLPRTVSLSVPDLKRIINRTVLLGDPGGGKTTAVKFLLNEFAADPRGKVPFLVTLRKYAAEIPLKWSVVGYIEQTLATLYQTPPPDGFVERLLLTGRPVVIFDGLDELLDTSRRREVSERVEQFSSAYPLTPILVTSRVVGYDQARLDEEQFTCYRLGGFDDDRAVDYITKWFAYHDGTSQADSEEKARIFLRESEGAKDLRANPLLLSLMCILYRGTGSLPGDRAGIYTKCAELLFRKWDEQRDLYRKLRADYLVEPILRHLAWWLFTRDDTSAAATEEELSSETTNFLHGRGFESMEEARAAAREFVEFCRGRMWVFSDTGTTAEGDKLYSFTHRTFLEYFTAWQLAATCDTPEDLADTLITSFRSSSGLEIVGELALQIKDRSTDQGADRAYQRILEQIDPVGEQAYRQFIKLLAKWLPGMQISPAITRRVTQTVLAQLLSSNSGTRLLNDLRQCGARHQSIVADELRSGITMLVTSEKVPAKLAGLQITLSMGMITVPPDEFWDNWSEEMIKLYAADAETFSVHSPALRTLALFKSVISIDQALAMPGGFGAISQRYPIMGRGPLVPYPLFETPDFGGADPDPASLAVSTAVGKYLVDHPALPWACGPHDRYNDIANWIDELVKVKLDELSGLGSAASYAVNAEFRGLERKSMGLAIQKLSMPPQFRQLFRDWTEGKVNLVEFRDR